MTTPDQTVTLPSPVPGAESECPDCVTCGQAADALRPVEARSSDGWMTIQVRGFDELMYALARAESKGYMPDAMRAEYEAFDYEKVSPVGRVAAPAVPSAHNLRALLQEAVDTIDSLPGYPKGADLCDRIEAALTASTPEPTEAQIEAGASALTDSAIGKGHWANASEESKAIYRGHARNVLKAALT